MAVERKRSSRRSTYRHYSASSGKKPPQISGSVKAGVVGGGGGGGGGTGNTTGSKCRSCCRKFTAFMFSHVGLCGLVVGYSIVGAFAFRALESPIEHEKTREVIAERNKTVEALWTITERLNTLYRDNWTRLVAVEIKEFQMFIVKAIKDGYDGKDLGNERWSFSRAFLYSLTVITTIGYGNISPRSPWGRVVTIVYSIFGIPLMLLYLTNIGDILAKSFKYVYSRVCRCSGGGGSGRGSRPDAYYRRRPRPPPGLHENYRAHHMIAQNSPHKHNSTTGMGPGGVGGMGGVGGGPMMTMTTAEMAGKMLHAGGHHVLREDEVRIEAIPDAVYDDDDGGYDKPHVTVPITLCLIVLVGYIGGGAILFALWEGWGYLDSSYFCFVTLSTIGFGDLVPGDSTISDDGSQEKLVLCSLYLLVGMAVIAMCFNLMQEEVIHKVRNFGLRIGIIKAIDDDDDDDDDEDDYDLDGGGGGGGGD